jgi:GTPase SAR1 family protein
MAEITEPFQELNVGIVNEDGDQLTDGITDTEFLEFRMKCKRFRVLIIGPRNAGKTTILERLTGDKIERAEFKSPEGNLINGQLEGSMDRGSHDIQTEITFPSKPGFVFHDSEGFESGPSSETGETVLTFIGDRSNAVRPDLQLHAVWYCIPLPDVRGLSENELQMFKIFESTVPTIIIFTQSDKKMRLLLADLMPYDDFTESDINRLRPTAEVKAREHYVKLKDSLVARGLSKARFAVLGGLDKNTEESSQQCKGLVQLTENTLPAMSRLLLASVHVNNLHSRIRFAIRRMLRRAMDLQRNVHQTATGSSEGNIFSRLRRKLVSDSESWGHSSLENIALVLFLYLPHLMFPVSNGSDINM